MLSKIKLKIMIKAFRIRLDAGENFDEIVEIRKEMKAWPTTKLCYANAKSQ